MDVLGQPGQAAVARLVGVENLFRMRVESRHPRDGTMRLSGVGVQAGFALETPLGSDPPDSGEEWVTVGIRASDIILSSLEPVGIVGSQPDSWDSDSYRTETTGLHGGVGLRGVPALPGHRSFFGRNGHPRRTASVGCVQGVILLPGPRRYRESGQQPVVREISESLQLKSDLEDFSSLGT